MRQIYICTKCGEISDVWDRHKEQVQILYHICNKCQKFKK